MSDTEGWTPSSFLVAMPDGASERSGYVYKSLGLWVAVPPSAKGKHKAVWSLTHLGSGHKIIHLTGDVRTVFPIASEIAELADWDFDGLDGWKNRDPELGEKISAVVARHSKIVGVQTQSPVDREASQRVAREIAVARAI